MNKKIFFGHDKTFYECKKYLKQLYISHAIDKIIYIAPDARCLPMFTNQKTVLFCIFNQTVDEYTICRFINTTENCVCFINKKYNNALKLNIDFETVNNDRSTLSCLHDVEAYLYDKQYNVALLSRFNNFAFNLSYYSMMQYLFYTKNYSALSFKEYFYFLCFLYNNKSYSDYTLLNKINEKMR